MEILLLHPGGLGDIVLSLPAIALLREKFPAARITLAGNIDHLRAIEGFSVESVISLSTLPLHNLYSDKPPSQPDLDFWNSFDRIISWTGSGDPAFTANLKKIHPKACVAPWRPGPQETRHVSQLFVDSLGPEISGGRTANPVRIVPKSEASREGLKWLAGRSWSGTHSITALHPGAGSRAKQWPLSRFVDLGRHLLLRRSTKLLIVEGPAEAGIGVQMIEDLRASDCIVAKSLPLDLLAVLIGQCRLFVGSDSGIAHLAAVLGVPSVVLFGPTLPQHWAPLGRNVKVVSNCSGRLEDITVNDVLEALSL